MANPDLLPYPIALSPLLHSSSTRFDEAGVVNSFTGDTTATTYDPTAIAQYALVQWNAYVSKREQRHKEAFLVQAYWLLAHQWHFTDGSGGWPVPCVANVSNAELCLSASTQGTTVSVLLRAYQLTSKNVFLRAAHCAVQTFARDILDGGIHSPVGETGIFFEESAVYPASHALIGHILALFALYDYVMLTGDTTVEVLVQRGIVAVHTLVEEFDAGYWTYSDLLHQRLASPLEHTLHVTVLDALAQCSDSEQCAALAVRWHAYQHNFTYRLRYLVVSRLHAHWNDTLKPVLRQLVLPGVVGHPRTAFEHVCVPITAFPVAGGMRGVLSGVAQVMGDQWRITYVTHYKGQHTEDLAIETFGRRIASPWQFPGLWLYAANGCLKLLTLLRSGTGYDLLLPQDGVFSAAFAAIVGKMAGIRVVGMDHGNVTLLDSPSFQRESLDALSKYAWPERVLLSSLLHLYWPSQLLLARFAARHTTHFLVAGDEVEEVYRTLLGVHPHRITRYAYMIDVARFTHLAREERLRIRVEQGLTQEAIVITLINRLSAEKGLYFALEGIAAAMSMLSGDVRARVKVLIVGNGPLRSQVVEDIQRLGLDSVCVLWGEAAPHEVVKLLGITDIFLYSGTRGTNYSMAVLEAMAVGCAVIASVVPQSNVRLLAGGRGIAISPASASEISAALVRLCNDADLCRTMGQSARDYVAAYHSASALKRNLQRASFFVPLLEERALAIQPLDNMWRAVDKHYKREDGMSQLV